jgi:N-acetylated-alpha-linked acidic dipeptidase
MPLRAGAPLLLVLVLAAAAGAGRAAAELNSLESAFVAVPNAQRARENLRFITSEPHVAGTPGDLKMAHFVHDELLDSGLEDVAIQPVQALLSFPISRSLEMLRGDGSGEVVYTAALEEKVLPEDETSDTPLRKLTYNGYGPSGEVTAPLVWGNFGRPEDLEALAEAGVAVEGSIVLVRYGKCFRGLKVMNAQNAGAVGVLIMSDPEQDGFTRGPTWPDGPWRPESSVQRGSVQFNSLCAGDPSRSAAGSPTVGEVCGYAQEDLYPRIPVLPLSYGDALPLVRALGGPLPPEGFRGGLDAEYRLGPSQGLVHLSVENEFRVGSIWNVIATVPGSLPADEDRPVLLGNHRDAWVFGAVDPNSGTAALLEVARGLGSLMASGWRPLRTIVLASWSGEELGMLGSTAFGEANAAWLAPSALAYLNVDEAVSGDLLDVHITPSLTPLLRRTLGDVTHPRTNTTLLEAWSGNAAVLGSGSDYAVFLHHLGIASIDFGFRYSLHDAEYGVYHSIYDSMSWVEREGDPDFKMHVAASQLWGLLALRLADSDVVPFDPVEQGRALLSYVDTVSQAAFTAAVPLDVQLLRSAAEAFLVAAQELSWEATNAPACAENLADINDRLGLVERNFLLADGLPKRKWFKHALQAPGIYLGYQAEVFPGISWALGESPQEAQREADNAADCILQAANFLQGIAPGRLGALYRIL